jgi:ribose transport system permease protein
MSTDTTLDDAIGRRTNRGIVAWLLSRQVFWIFLATVVACIALSVLTTSFDTPRNIYNVTRNFAFVGIIALGMTAVIMIGGIDLSVGSTVLISAMVTTMLMHSGAPLWIGLPAGVGAGVAVGLVNGFLIAYVGMQPFVVTLGMMSIVRSLGMVLSNNQLISDFGPDQEALFDLGGGTVTLAGIAIPNPVIALVVLGVVTGLAFRWTRWGRYLYAIGGNEKAAVLNGVPVRAVKLSVYAFAGFVAGITGFLELGWLGTVSTGLGNGMELTVIAAAVIGGANLAGGAGTAFGAIVGAALIEVIRNSLILLGVSTFWHGTFVGTFIVIAVAFDRLRNQDTSE